MIVKNESKHLAACLDTVKDIADEIVILDSGSSDNTRQIAENYGAKWYVNTDWQGFGRQRQLAQHYATGDYVLALDADERLDQDLRQAIVNILNQPVQTDKVFSLAYINYFSGRDTHISGWYRPRRNRLYAREYFGYSDLEVHESVNTEKAKIVKLSGFILHYTNNDLYHYMVKNVQYSHAWADDKFKRGKKAGLIRLIVHSIFSFIRGYWIRGQFLAGVYGWIAPAALMNYTFNKDVSEAITSYLYLYESIPTRQTGSQ